MKNILITDCCLVLGMDVRLLGWGTQRSSDELLSILLLFCVNIGLLRVSRCGDKHCYQHGHHRLAIGFRMLVISVSECHYDTRIFGH